MKCQSIEYITPADVVRQTIERRREWIESELGVPLSSTVFLETRLDLAQIALDDLLGCSAEEESTPKAIRRFRPLIAGVAIPPDFPPLFNVRKGLPSVSLQHLRYGGLNERQSSPSLEWQDCPVAIKPLDRATPLITWNIPYHTGPRSDTECIANMVIARREDAAQVVHLITTLNKRDKKPKIHMLRGSTRAIARCDWDDMVLDPKVVSLLKADFDFFFERKEWFRKAQLPHRRGYLLHGPPGNGKSTAIRCMMSCRGLSAYTLRLFDKDVSDGDLEVVFDMALREHPALVVLEDLDRAFPKAGSPKTNVSFQQLLNTLDGIASGEGIIVVATANEPTLLDPAILRRPGRFDRVVHFPNPNYELRKAYFLSRKYELASGAIDRVAQASKGFSFAQLREVYIIAGQQAFERQDNILETDLLMGICSLRQSVVAGSRHNNAAGFLAEMTGGTSE
jgi:hypothetical protein